MDIGLRYDKDFTVYVHGIPPDVELPTDFVKVYDEPGFETRLLKIGEVKIKLFVDKERKEDNGKVESAHQI